jgi:saccharopine dehydrogenase-like NADP-dependent oxidoreductase
LREAFFRMKLLVLGGGGHMGGYGVKILQHFPGIESVVLADINMEAAEELAKELNFPEVSTVHLDVTDTKRITELASEFDVVFNAVGPYMKFGVPTLEAVIEAGVDYLDVCDDHDATEEMLNLHDKAEKAGMTAIVSLGQSPGITNMQAKYVSEMLDSVDSMKVVWAVGIPPLDVVLGTPLEPWVKNIRHMHSDPDLFAQSLRSAWVHMIHTCSGEIPVWKDGKWDTMPAWDIGEYVDFAEPLGRVQVFYVGHSEPVTLPRYIKIKDFCACLGTLPPGVNEKLRMEARGHEEPLQPGVAPDTPLWPTPEKWKDLGVWQGTAAIAEGWKDGKKVRYTNRCLCSVFDRGVFNFVGQATGIYLLGKTKDKKKGVFAPEGILDTQDFFKEITRVTNEINSWDFTLEELMPTEREVIG